MGKRQVTSKEALFNDAISTLKRATGIPNAAERDDAWGKGHSNVYTSDLESAKILGNLISQALMGLHRHTERYWNTQTHGDFGGLHGTLQVSQIDEKLFTVSFPVPEVCLRDFAKQINQKTQLLIAPDSPPRTRG